MFGLTKKDIGSILAISEIDAILIFIIAKNIALKIPFHPALIFILLPVVSICGFIFLSFFREKIRILWQFAKFLLIGTLNTFVDLGVLNALIFFSGIASGIYFPLFKAISFAVANINSYFWNKHWTFAGEGSKKAPQEFGIFFIVSIGGLVINVLSASFIVNIIGPQFGLTPEIWANIGGICASFIGMAWNFIGYKIVVFKKIT
ncbi:MAG: GtrA family protein [bacterium]|nr:GtrA family protein [bacterium]